MAFGLRDVVNIFKNLVGIFLAILFMYLGYQGYKWLTGRDRLKPDGIAVFSSIEDLKARYPFVQYIYAGSMRNISKDDFTADIKTSDANTRVERKEYFVKLSFEIKQPAKEVAKMQNVEFAKIVASKGSKKYDPELLSKLKLFIFSGSLQIGSNIIDKCVNFYYQEGPLEATMASEETLIQVNPANNHLLGFGPDVKITFNEDFTEAQLTGKHAGKLKRVDKYQAPGLSGAYLLHMTLVDLLNKSMTGDYHRLNRIKMDVPAVFKPDGFTLGRVCVYGKTYDMQGYKDDKGIIKIYLSDMHYLTVKLGSRAISILHNTGEQVGLAFNEGYYRTEIEKAKMSQEKEKELMDNIQTLGDTPDSVPDMNTSWSYYFDIREQELTDQDILADEQLAKLFQENALFAFNHRDYYSRNKPTEKQPATQTKQPEPKPVTKSQAPVNQTPPKQKVSDDELARQKMLEQMKKKH
jgi:hypothetical protein